MNKCYYTYRMKSSCLLTFCQNPFCCNCKHPYEGQHAAALKSSVLDPYSLNPDAAKNLNPVPDPDSCYFLALVII